MPLINHCINCLQDACYYLKVLSQEAYQTPIPLLSDSTIGQHTRHFIEFYQCLLQQADSGIINYDLRQRDRTIEEQPEVALMVIENVIMNLQKLQPERVVRLEAEMNGTIQVTSNLGRELLYNLEHCIHHLAIIKIGLAIISPALQLPATFGIAASTTKHREGHLSVSN